MAPMHHEKYRPTYYSEHAGTQVSRPIIVFGGIVRIQKEYSLGSIPWLPAQPTRYRRSTR